MNIKKKALNSAKWSVIQNWTNQFLSLFIFIVLARLLLPEDFGLVALATAFIMVLTTLSSQGFVEAIVQREEISDTHLDTAFWTNLTLGLLMAAALYATAPFLADSFSEPRLSKVLRFLSLTLILNSCIGVQTAILSRHFQFKALALRTILSSVLGGGVGIYMAFMGYGVWALVGQQVIISLTGLFVLWFSCSWYPGLKVKRKAFFELISFGSNVLGISLLNLVNKRMPDMLIGIFLGPTALGIYAIAMKIFTVLTQVMLGTLSKVALPTFSRMQSDIKRMRQAYYNAIRMTSIVCFPVFIGVLVTAENLVPLIFGSQWEQSASVTQYLMVVCIMYGISYFNTPMMLALNQSRMLLKLNVINSCLNAIAFSVGVNFGIEYVAMAFMIRGLIMFPVGQLVLKYFAEVSFMELFHAIKGPAISSIIMAVLILLINPLIESFSKTYIVLCQVIGGGAIYMLSLMLIDRSIIFQMLEYFQNKDKNE